MLWIASVAGVVVKGTGGQLDVSRCRLRSRWYRRGLEVVVSGIGKLGLE